MKRRILIALVLLLSFSTYQIKDNYILNSKFKIDQIFIENNNILKDEKIKNNL